jgi:hypothetical protein
MPRYITQNIFNLKNKICLYFVQVLEYISLPQKLLQNFSDDECSIKKSIRNYHGGENVDYRFLAYDAL